MTNPMYDDGAHDAPTTREAGHYPPPPQQQYPYGYGGYSGGGYASPWRRRGTLERHGAETKPFYLTSEFMVSLLAAIAIAISAATMHAFGGWRGWILITAIVVSYNLSRGIAKVGSSSRAHDPREDVRFGAHDNHRTNEAVR
jgi:hypothetical protein